MMASQYPEGEDLFVEIRANGSICVVVGDSSRDKMAQTVIRRFQISHEQAALPLDELRRRIDANEIVEVQPPPKAPKPPEKRLTDWQWALEEGRARGVNGIRRYLDAHSRGRQMRGNCFWSKGGAPDVA